MAEDKGNESEKFDFTAEGEGYISLDQAMLLARQRAQEDGEHYRQRLDWDEIAWSEVSSEQREDTYRVVLRFQRPAREVREEQTGEEEFVFDLNGALVFRQVLVWPEGAASLEEPSPPILIPTPTPALTPRLLQDLAEHRVLQRQVRSIQPSSPQPIMPNLDRASAPTPTPYFTNEAGRDTAHSEANTSIPATNRLRSIPIKIASWIVGLWAGFLWFATIAVRFSSAEETHSAMWLLYLGGAIASTVAVVLMSKMNKPNANALVVEDKFRAGPLIRLILIGVLIIGSVISVSVIAASLD